MPDLRLTWADYPGGYGTQVAGPQTIDAGGVDVTVDVINDIESSVAFALNLETYDDPGDSLPPSSQLKLVGDSGTAGVNGTSTTVLTFASSDPLYSDGVTGLRFRIDDIDAGDANDVDGSAVGIDPHIDIVNVRAFDLLGNEIPVTITPGTGMSQTGQTLTGVTEGAATDAAQSALIDIPGPVGRVEIDYDNGDAGSHEILVSDLLFTTIDVDLDAPDAVNDLLQITEVDTAIADIDVLGNDTDPNGDTLTVTDATAPNGTVAINPDGTLTYTPDPGFVGSDTITYTISDGNGGSDSAIVPITVGDPGEPPVAVDDLLQSTPEDTLLEDIDVLGNDSDPDGDPLTVTAATAPNGTVTINPDGTLDYQPDPGFTGTDTITYTIDDGNGGTDTAEVPVSVGGANSPPTAVDDPALTTGFETPIESIDVLGNDSDPDGDPLEITAASALNGTVVVNPDGTLEYIPNNDFLGEDTVTYTITDNISGSDTATFTVTVGDPNGPPVAVDDILETTPEDTLLEDIDVLGNDSDPDGDPLTVTAATAPNGTVTINPDGTLDYQPDPGFNGTDTITYTIDDGNGGTDTAEVPVSVGGANSPPTAVDDPALTTGFETPIESIDVLGNDSDPDGDPLEITAASALNGTVVVNPDGTLEYIPNNDFLGEDTVTYTITDNISGSDTATFTVTVGDPNGPPVAVDDILETTPEDTLLEDIDVLGNDSDPDGDPLTVTAATAPNGTVTINPDGTLDYQPDPGFNGTDTITYTIDDGNGGTDTAEVPVTVGTNDPPVAVDDAPETTDLDTPITGIDVLGNDSDPDGDPLTVTDAISPNGTVTINLDGTLDYAPDLGFLGTDTITYTITDSISGSDTATVLVTVTDPAAPNDPPIAVNDAVTASTDIPLEDIDVLGNDTDPNGDPLTVTAATSDNGGTVTINPDGTLDYTSPLGFEGTDLIRYTIDDGNGGTDEGIVRVSVRDDGPANQAPTAEDDTASTPEDTLLEDIDVLGNDTDPEGDPLTVTSATAPNGTVTINPDGTLDYQPDPGFSGPDTISYVIDDGNGNTDIGTVAVTVGTPPANDPPVANDDAALTTPVDTLIEDIDVLSNDSDPDGDPITITTATAPNGTVTINPDGTLDYQPNPGFVGTDTVSYTITDSISGTDDATFTVTVGTTANLPPEPNNDIASTPVDTLLDDLNVLGNDADPDGDPLTVTSATAPNGTVTVNPDGTLDYQPDPGFEGTDIITYVVDDGNGNTAPAEVIVTVGEAPSNAPPVAVDDVDQVTDVDTPIANIDVLGNDSDPDGDPLTVIDAVAQNGTVTINPDGTLNYQPDPGFEGEDTITYQITDDISGNDTAELTVFVGTPNTDPNADPDTSSTDPVTPVTIFPLGNDTDPEGDPLIITSATAPNGTVTVAPDGSSVTYTPNPGFEDDVDTITYSISDGNGGTDTTTIQVLVGTPPLDGIVEGTGAGEYIGEDDPTTTPVDPYLGDPEGDQVDNDDAIEPEAGSNDDVIQAGGGDDTIEAGEGNDNVDGGEGDDIIDTGEGDDFVLGDGFGDPLTVNGSDSIDTGDGDDTVFADDFGSPSPGGDDTVTTGDGNDSVGTGGGDDVIDTSGTIPLLDEAPFPSIPTDDDPEDDRDFVDAAEGNDLITTGDDDDTIIGGEGNDTIFSGIDDDSVIGDGGDDSIIDIQGADFIDGGDGDDTINAGVDSFTDYVGDDPNLPITDSGITFVTDPSQDDGRDTVFGGAGEDVISTGDDADSIDGGDDNDTIFAGIDDDTVRGGDGDDSIEGGHGADTIAGGAGNDYIDAGHTSTTTLFEDEPDATEPVGLELNDRDVVFGGNGDDTIIGGDDDDSLVGGSGLDSIDGGIDEDTIDGQSGNDTLEGGEGDDSILGGTGADSILGEEGSDTIDGGSGNDTITGGEDADSIFGGAGEDSIIGATSGDTIDGGEGPVDFDVLDLRGAGELENAGGRVTVDYDAPGSEGGVVNFLDAADVVTGTARFDNIENIIPCFTPGTMIATPTGERAVEDLKVGDRVITRDNGIQEIRWAGAKELSGAQLAANDHLQPVLIQAGALGHNLPERDILVSPQHRMLLTTDQATMYFEEREVLVAAKHLTMLDGVDRVESSGTTYIHIMFEQHEVVLSNGTWSESFQPGEYTLDGIGKEQRDEILELFPELATQVGTEAYQSARRTLKKYEAALLIG